MAKTLKNTVIQISEDQHLDEERFVINYYDDSEPEEVDRNKILIVKKSELFGSALDKYNAFKEFVETKMNEE